MDETALAVFATIPNLGIAVWVIWQYQGTIRTLLDNQQKLIEQLMALHPPQDEHPHTPIVTTGRQ